MPKPKRKPNDPSPIVRFRPVADDRAEHLNALDKRARQFLRTADWVALRSPNTSSDLIFRVCKELTAVAELYSNACYMEAFQPRSKSGRPRKMADIAFCYGMIDITGGSLGLRTVKNGSETTTKFQKLCNSWLLEIDPEREPLKQTAFREAMRLYQKRRSPTDGGNSPPRSK